MKFHLVIPSPDFEEGLTFFRDELGFVLDKISPAETPSQAELSGYGLTIWLDKFAKLEPVTLRVATEDARLSGSQKVGPNGTKVIFGLPQLENNVEILTEPSIALNEALNVEWTTGRAGMMYRNLLPSGPWNFIASHIKIPGSGNVPDWVHHHDAQFQIIYCYKGAAKLVYEDQGPPFIFKAGDCVLQPPHIRHQVLESFDDLEVIEVMTPLIHSTFSDHVMKLPNDEFDPGRIFESQRFIWNQSKDRQWKAISGSSDSHYQVGETGIREASAHRGDVQILRSVAGEGNGDILIPSLDDSGSKFILWFVLSGTASFVGLAEVPVCDVSEGDAISLINAPLESRGRGFRLPSDDFAVLEVRLPQ
tara:strand:+ start:523 stop:1611 length:1089 start_codon:yes stop_codon:yes gene_type:complete